MGDLSLNMLIQTESSISSKRLVRGSTMMSIDSLLKDRFHLKNTSVNELMILPIL